jgi:hypothetical protein
MNPQLARICAAFAAHRRSLEPDQLGAASCETLVSPPGKLRWPPFGIAVAPFHGMYGDGVSYRGITHLDSLRERCADSPRIVQKDDVPRPGVGRRLPDFVHGIEVEVPHVPASTLERRTRTAQHSHQLQGNA